MDPTKTGILTALSFLAFFVCAQTDGARSSAISLRASTQAHAVELEHVARERAAAAVKCEDR